MKNEYDVVRTVRYQCIMLIEADSKEEAEKIAVEKGLNDPKYLEQIDDDVRVYLLDPVEEDSE